MAELDEGGGRGRPSSSSRLEEPPPAKRPKTICELRQEIQTSLSSGKSLTVEYEGRESLEEVLEELFSEPVESVDNPEMMYQKLMAELEAAGLNSSEMDKNCSRKKHQSEGFRNSQELIDFLLQEDDTSRDKVDGKLNGNGDRDIGLVKMGRKSVQGDEGACSSTGDPTHVVVVRKEDRIHKDEDEQFGDLVIHEGPLIRKKSGQKFDEAKESQGESSLSSQRPATPPVSSELSDPSPVDEHLGLSFDEFISAPTTSESHTQPGTTTNYFKTDNIDELIKELDPNMFQLCQADLDLYVDDGNSLPADTLTLHRQDDAHHSNRVVLAEGAQPISQAETLESVSATQSSVKSDVLVESSNREECVKNSTEEELMKQYNIKTCYIYLDKLDSSKVKTTVQTSATEVQENTVTVTELPNSEVVVETEKEITLTPSVPSPPPPKESIREDKAKSDVPIVVKSSTKEKDSVAPVPGEKVAHARSSNHMPANSAIKEKLQRIDEIIISSSDSSDDEYVPLGPALLYKDKSNSSKVNPDLSCQVIDKKSPSLPKTIQQVAATIITPVTPVPVPRSSPVSKQQKTEMKFSEVKGISEVTGSVSPGKSSGKSHDVLLGEKDLEEDKVAQGIMKSKREEAKTEVEPTDKKKTETKKVIENPTLPDSELVKTRQLKITKSPVAGPSKVPETLTSENVNSIVKTTRGRGIPGRRSKISSDSQTDLQDQVSKLKLKKKLRTESTSSSESISSKESGDLPTKKKKRNVVSSESDLESVSEVDSVEFKHPKAKRGKAKVLPDSNESLTDMMVTECFKNHPDFDLLIRIMNKTRPFRKTFLPANEFDVAIALKKFPGLRDYRIMKHEMNRLTERKGQKLNRSNIETLEGKLAQEMLNASKVKKRPGLERNELWVRAIEMSKDPTKSPEEKKVLGMYCLCFHLIENDANGSLFQIRRENQRSKWKQMGFPTIDILETEVFSAEAEDMWVYAEGLQACRVPNFYEGVLTCYAMHYVFDMEYHEKVRNFYEHFDSLVGF